MDDMDVRAAPFPTMQAPPALLWETRYGICRRLKIDPRTLRRMIRTGEIETQTVHGERVFREGRPKSTALRPHLQDFETPVIQRADGPQQKKRHWIVDTLVEHLTRAQRRIGALTAQRDAMADQIRDLQALVDVQDDALASARALIDLKKGAAGRTHGARIIRRFGQEAAW
jgi:hypothetical protein